MTRALQGTHKSTARFHICSVGVTHGKQDENVAHMRAHTHKYMQTKHTNRAWVINTKRSSLCLHTRDQQKLKSADSEKSSGSEWLCFVCFLDPKGRLRGTLVRELLADSGEQVICPMVVICPIYMHMRCIWWSYAQYICIWCTWCKWWSYAQYICIWCTWWSYAQWWAPFFYMHWQSSCLRRCD